jgi:hypothetical protein
LRGEKVEIQLDFVSSDFLTNKRPIEKIDFIIQKIKKNVIVVLEEGLTPQEETELIETTMREIDAKDFHGIEFYRIDHQPGTLRDKLASYISGKKSGMTIVGPTRMVEAIKRDPNGISMLAKIEAPKKKAKPKKKKAKTKKKQKKKSKSKPKTKKKA